MRLFGWKRRENRYIRWYFRCMKPFYNKMKPFFFFVNGLSINLQQKTAKVKKPNY